MKKFFVALCIAIIFNISYAESVNYLSFVNYANTTSETIVTLNCTKPITYKEGKLTDSKKIYFDFYNTVIKEPVTIDVNKNSISKIRYAQNAIKPEFITRVVFDMEEMKNYTVEMSEDKKQLYVKFPTSNTTTSVSRGEVERPVNVQEKKLIVIDAGHGGKDPGAVFSDIEEKSLNLDIAKRLGKLLEKAGYEVIMTRDTDEFIELATRAEIANENKADLFISIHNNSMPSGFAGVMTLYNSRDINDDFSSKDLAEAILKQVETLDYGSIGARERNDLVVLKKTTMPAVIVEVACMSDSTDLKLLTKVSFRKKVAQAICDAVKQLDF